MRKWKLILQSSEGVIRWERLGNSNTSFHVEDYISKKEHKNISYLDLLKRKCITEFEACTEHMFNR